MTSIPQSLQINYLISISIKYGIKQGLMRQCLCVCVGV